MKQTLTHEEIKAALHAIGLALNASHNTVTTDLPGVIPGDNSWRIDHSKEIDLIRKLEATFLENPYRLSPVVNMVIAPNGADDPIVQQWLERLGYSNQNDGQPPENHKP